MRQHVTLMVEASVKPQELLDAIVKIVNADGRHVQWGRVRRQSEPDAKYDANAKDRNQT